MKSIYWARAAALAAAMVFAATVMAGCAGTQASSTDSAGASSTAPTSVPSSSREEEPPAQEPVVSSEASSLPGSVSVAQAALEPGAFAGAGDYAKEEYRPQLTLEADGTAVLRENLLEGMGNFTGRYTEADGTVTMVVEEVDFAESFVCYNVREIVFAVQDEDTLVLQTELCASVPGAVFSRTA